MTREIQRNTLIYFKLLKTYPSSLGLARDNRFQALNSKTLKIVRIRL